MIIPSNGDTNEAFTTRTKLGQEMGAGQWAIQNGIQCQTRSSVGGGCIVIDRLKDKRGHEALFSLLSDKGEKLYINLGFLRVIH